jgi:exoribonuclease II
VEGQAVTQLRETLTGFSTSDALPCPIQADQDSTITLVNDGSFFDPRLEIPQIITADCSFPKEIDDGIFVDQLDEQRELYRVGVCVADTSRLYANSDVVRQAYKKTAAKYWDLPGDERGYDPMIDPAFIREIEFTDGFRRDALIVTFSIGPKDAPERLGVSFGQVDVVKNRNYKEFSTHATFGTGKRFSRASECIRDHLGYVAYGDHTGFRPTWRPETDDEGGDPDLEGKGWKVGSKINESFMVAANHLVGLLARAESWPMIFRVHDPQDEQHLELVSSNVALYSRTPGRHEGLNLDPYCRVTSGLRRLDDFVNIFGLKQRALGRPVTTHDVEQVAFAVRRLNQEVITAASKEATHFSRRDLLGQEAGRRIIGAVS